MKFLVVQSHSHNHHGLCSYANTQLEGSLGFRQLTVRMCRGKRRKWQGQTVWCPLYLRPCFGFVCSVKMEKAGRFHYAEIQFCAGTSHQLKAKAFSSHFGTHLFPLPPGPIKLCLHCHHGCCGGRLLWASLLWGTERQSCGQSTALAGWFLWLLITEVKRSMTSTEEMAGNHLCCRCW